MVGSAAMVASVTKIGLFCSYNSAGVALETTKLNGGMEGGMVRAAIELHSVKASSYRPSGPPGSAADWREPAGASFLGNNFALFVTIFFYRCPRRNQYVSIFRRKLYCVTRIICVDHTSVGFLLVPT